MRKRGWLVAGLLGGWLLFAQSCMRLRTSDEKAERDFSHRGITISPQTLKVGTRTMHFVSVGDVRKPTLVFIHGSPGSWHDFARYLQDAELRDQYRLVGIDRPGFGYSDFGKAEGIGRQVALVSPVLLQLRNNQPQYLIGHSLGGPLVIQLTAANPDLNIEGVVILAGSVSAADEPRERWRTILDAPIVRWLLPGAFRPSNHELRLFKQDVLTLEPNFARIHCPVFILHGDKDPLVPPPNADYAKEKLVNARPVELIWLKNANHFIPWTRYDDIKAVLLRLSEMKHPKTD